MGDRASLGELFVEMLKSVRWSAPILLVLLEVLWLLDVEGLRSVPWWHPLLFGIAFTVCLGPLAWLRWSGTPWKSGWRFLLLSMLWAIVSGGVLVFLLDRY